MQRNDAWATAWQLGGYQNLQGYELDNDNKMKSQPKKVLMTIFYELLKDVGKIEKAKWRQHWATVFHGYSKTDTELANLIVSFLDIFGRGIFRHAENLIKITSLCKLSAGSV